MAMLFRIEIITNALAILSHRFFFPGDYFFTFCGTESQVQLQRSVDLTFNILLETSCSS